MSHEPGREAATSHACERCHALRPLNHYTFTDEYLCDECAHAEIAKQEADEKPSVFARGQIASKYGPPNCTCYGGPPHSHEIYVIWDGNKWLPLESSEALTLINSLKAANANNQ